SEPEQQEALANLEARLRERQELNEKYEAAHAQLAALTSEIEELRTAEEQTRNQIGEAKVALQAHDDAHQQAEAEARIIFETHEQRLNELRAIGKQIGEQAQQHAAEEARLQAEVEAAREAETEQLAQ